MVGSVHTLFPSLPAMHWDLTRLLETPFANIVTRLLVTRLFLTRLFGPILPSIITRPNSFTAINFALEDWLMPSFVSHQLIYLAPGIIDTYSCFVQSKPTGG